MKSLSAAILSLGLAFTAWSASPAAAEEQAGPVVVELFTSQGCSSCPPADALMHDLAGRSDVIALALHVDYWDYIGWKDEFAIPGHTARQKAYARNGGRRMIYTPQMIVMGQESIVGAKAMKLADLIAAHKALPAPATVLIHRQGPRVTVDLAPRLSPSGGPFDVQLVRFDPHRTVKITRGENAGRTLDYANIVLGWHGLGTWDGVAAVTLSADLPDDMPVAVLVQRRDTGAIAVAGRSD